MSVSTTNNVDNVENVTNVSALDRKLNLAQAADLHPALTQTMIRASIHDGKLPATRVGSRYFVSAEEIVKHLVSEIA